MMLLTSPKEESPIGSAKAGLAILELLSVPYYDMAVDEPFCGGRFLTINNSGCSNSFAASCDSAVDSYF